ncbi:MAG: hypothetical protein ACLQBY_03170 [Solirubrobacteraceae bacterium]
MSAQNGKGTTGPNFAAAVDGPNFAAAVDGPNFAAAVDGPTEASIESFLRCAFQPAGNVT